MNKNKLTPHDIEKSIRTLMTAPERMDAMDLKRALEGDPETRTACYPWHLLSDLLMVLETKGIVKPAGITNRGLQGWTCTIKAE